jgi:UDP-N-acetylmuramoyl-L-alanyl-D-glutamate--2,6-diaminopimelate ligase
MLLGDLATADLTLPESAGTIDIAVLSADSRADRTRLSPSLRCPAARPTARFAADAIGRGAVAIPPPALGDARGRGAYPDRQADDPRHTLALMAAFPSAPAGEAGRRHRNQRQDGRRRVRPPDLRGGRQERGERRDDRRRQPRPRSEYGNLTTPDPVAAVRHASTGSPAGSHSCRDRGSSHGLDQRRLDGIRIAAAAFTNLGRDHMDYHATVADYLGAKLRLVTTILPKDGTAIATDLPIPGSRDDRGERGARLIRTAEGQICCRSSPTDFASGLVDARRPTKSFCSPERSRRRTRWSPPPRDRAA